MSDINTAILAELKKINEFLGKMDWKLWNIHEKYLNQEPGEQVVVKEVIKEVVKEVVVEEPAPTATVAAAAEVPKFVPKVVAPVTNPVASNIEEPPVSVIPDIPKYPSIEKA